MPADPTISALISGPGSWCKIGPITRTAGNGEAVVTMPSAVKNRLLGDSTSLSSSVRQKAEGILRKIHNKQVAALLGFKETAVSKAPFRLVKRIAADSKPEIRDSANSFIALSYCWHEKDWLPAGSGGSATGGAVPISPILFEALLEERLSDDEGVWIDQMCIVQSDEVEKAMAIGSMDVIYRRARLVVVVLEDIVIDGSDVAALQELMRALDREHKWLYRNNLAPSRQLTKLLWKIFSARWFTRAWCGHELLVSSNQLFLIQSDVADASLAVVKMTSEFLFDLSILAKGITSYLAVNDFAQLETTYGRQLSRFYTYATPKYTTQWMDKIQEDKIQEDKIQEDKIQEDRAFTQSYMRVFSQIFGFNASVVTDKLSIVLNVLQCGLFYSGPSMTPDQCCYVFYHIALAAGDPTSLSACGKQLEQAVWMRWPRGEDIIEPYTTRLVHMCLEQTPAFDDETLELDMIFLGASADMHRATRHHMDWANGIIQKCIEHADEFPDQGSDFLEDVARAPTDKASARKQYHAELLACVHECGIDWLVRSWQQKDPELFDDETRQGIRRVMEIHPEQLDGDDPTRREDLLYVLYLFDGLSGAWLSEEKGASWRPAWVQPGESASSRQLLLCPENRDYVVAIPVLLLRAEYSYQKRVWFLAQAPREGNAGENYSEVIGKSCSFGDNDLRKLRKPSMVMRSQRICG